MCQSWVVTTRSYSARCSATNRAIASATSLPPSTPSAPPSQKVGCTSTTSSARRTGVLSIGSTGPPTDECGQSPLSPTCASRPTQEPSRARNQSRVWQDSGLGGEGRGVQRALGHRRRRCELADGVLETFTRRGPGERLGDERVEVGLALGGTGDDDDDLPADLALGPARELTQ